MNTKIYFETGIIPTVIIVIGADPDNRKRGYDGKHEKESSKLLQTRSPHGALCFGIENFCNQAKRHMRKFNGVHKDQFGLYLKECEWRFNNSGPSRQLLLLRQWVKRHLK
jgi:transposase-like protein